MTKKLGSVMIKDLNATHTEISRIETMFKKQKTLALEN